MENQRNAGRIAALRCVKIPIRFLSFEPLLGPINADLSGISWVITGGESGPQISHNGIGQARALVSYEGNAWVPKPTAIAWVRAIRDQCLAEKVAYLHKQWGGPRPDSGGRLLDGRVWEEFPKTRT